MCHRDCNFSVWDNDTGRIVCSRGKSSFPKPRMQKNLDEECEYADVQEQKEKPIAEQH